MPCKFNLKSSPLNVCVFHCLSQGKQKHMISHMITEKLFSFAFMQPYCAQLLILC